jgi:hypothetical protein
MPAETLTPAHAASLLQRQSTLQAEAEHLIADLNLMPILRHAGQPEQIGSSVSGLMVWRDIDISIPCRDLTAQRVFETLLPLLTNPHTMRAEYRNETGDHTPAELRGDERYYVVLHHQSPDGNEWKIDLSFWLSDAPKDHTPYVQRVVAALTDETRLAILWIKDVWHHLPTYPYEVGGTDVYDAVLHHHVRTPGEFDIYLQERGLPGQ